MFARRRDMGTNTVWLLVMSLLFSQLALANYLCPAQAPAPDMAAMMAAGVPCEETDPAQPTLCHQHMSDPGQVVQAAEILAPSVPAVLHVLLVPVVPTTAAEVVPRASTPEAQPPPDPIFLATLRLRV